MINLVNLSIDLDDQDKNGQQQQSAREITPHFDRKGKYSQKRTRESTILKSKVHLATSRSRVWPVTIFNTGGIR